MSKKVLDSTEVLRLMREEWSIMKEGAIKEVAAERDGKPIITQGLKITDEVGHLFTVVSVGNSGAVLEDPDGKNSLVPWEQIEKDYKLS